MRRTLQITLRQICKTYEFSRHRCSVELRRQCQPHTFQPTDVSLQQIVKHKRLDVVHGQDTGITLRDANTRLIFCDLRVVQRKIGVNVSFLLRMTAEASQVWFARYAVFRKACFLLLYYKQ